VLVAFWWPWKQSCKKCKLWNFLRTVAKTCRVTYSRLQFHQ